MLLRNGKVSGGRWGIVVATALACVVVFSACGGSSSSSEEGTSSPDKSSPSNAAGEPSAEFVGKGPNGKLATVGKESSVEEREAASRTVEESLAARESGDWAGQCETLSATLVKSIENSSSVFKAGCPARLEAQARNAPKAVLENTMTGPIAALRVNGNRAFAFYHGARGKDYVILMERDGTGWKVGALSPQAAP